MTSTCNCSVCLGNGGTDPAYIPTPSDACSETATSRIIAKLATTGV